MRAIHRVSVIAMLVSSAAGRAAPTPWVARSNADAQPLLSAIGRCRPETASGWGLARYDRFVIDAGPGADDRARSALAQARAGLGSELARETDPRVREDLRIMIHAADLRIDDVDLTRRHLLPYVPVAEAIFGGEFTLLNPEAAAARHAAALDRLKRYTGLCPGTTPLVDLARRRFEERLSDPKLLGPFRGEIEQDLANTSRYAEGVRGLFAKNGISGAGAALDALDRLLAAYDAWIRAVVLPRSRTDFRLPPALYALQLRKYGIDIPPERLIRKAELEFSEVTQELDSLAPIVAKAHGWSDTGYRAVIRRLKADPFKPSEVEPYYQGTVIPRLEALIREHRVATLPNRPMAMRIASAAETAAEPAPHMEPPPLIDNRGERGTFVLTLGNPPSGKGQNELYDDFTFPAASWTLTAHEGRPGHKLQFSRMVENGVSQARAIFAFNSVNVEGWALYCESEMQPYEPPDGQLIALQFRLLRAVRAFVDPMLNLGMTDRKSVHRILVDDVCLSEAFAREELNRFTFQMPGQAASYFYGFSRLMELRAATQVVLGPKFDRLAFNDFIVDQGLLPPDLLAQAVKNEFIPRR